MGVVCSHLFSISYLVEEREESDDENAASEESDDEDDDIPYNPKNLPLGWDGKPIPYWLYKLHGLNLYFSCEICGNQTYRGPKAFLRHFAVSTGHNNDTPLCFLFPLAP